RVSRRETFQGDPTPACDLAELHEAKIDGEEDERQQEEPHRLRHGGESHDLEPEWGRKETVVRDPSKHEDNKHRSASGWRRGAGKPQSGRPQVQLAVFRTRSGEALVATDAVP